MRISDWSSDVCSSDLQADRRLDGGQQVHAGGIGGGIGGQSEVGGVVEAFDGDAEGSHERLRVPCSCWSEWRPRVAAICRQSRSATSALVICGQSSTPRSEEHTSELQSLMRISYAVFCLKTKNK